MTSRSIPAADERRVSAWAFCGLTRTAVVTPASRTRATPQPSRSGFSGASGAAAATGWRRRDPSSDRAASSTWATFVLDIGVPPDESLAVEHAEPAETAQFDGELGETTASVGCATGISNR